MFETLHSEVRYRGKAFDVRKDEVSLPHGGTTALDIVEHSGAVTIFPIDIDGRVWLVRQYRHATGGEILELPAGTLEEGEDPEACALREVQEEIGMAAGRMQKIGEFYLAPGYSTEFMHVYLATRLTPSSLPGDEDEYLRVENYPLAQLLDMASTGRIRDAKTLAALYLAAPHLEQWTSKL
jgi:ADP-ribose pyrophosphatase